MQKYQGRHSPPLGKTVQFLIFLSIFTSMGNIADQERYQVRLRSGMEQVTLDSEALHVPGTGRMRWSELTEVNLNYMPLTKYNEAHFLCRVYAGQHKVEFRAYAEYAIECKSYLALVEALHRRIIASEAKPAFTTGMRGQASYMAMVVGIVATFALLAILVVFAMASKGKVLLGMLLLAVIGALGLWLYRMAESLKPTPYDPAQPPAQMLPGGR